MEVAEGEKTAKKEENKTETLEESDMETSESENNQAILDWNQVISERMAEGKSTIGIKLGILRSLVNRQDWRNDKYVSGTSVSYPYLSIDKMKKTMAPLFQAAGLEVTPKFKIVSCQKDLSGRQEGDLHWVVKLKVTITDYDSGETDVSVVFGEGSDRADKGLIKAQTYALKAFFASKFCLADGIDPDAIDGGESRAFKPKSEEETAEVKSKILNAGVKKAKPAEVSVPKLPKKEKTVEKPAEKPEIQKKDEKEPEKPIDKPTETPEVEKPVEKSEKPVKKTEKVTKKAEKPTENDYKPAGPINNAIMQLLENIGTKYQEGKLTDAKVKEVQDAYANLTSDAEATAFIKKYRGL